MTFGTKAPGTVAEQQEQTESHCFHGTAARRDWVASTDDLGRAVLAWCEDPLKTRLRQDREPNARTDELLNCLATTGLELEDDALRRAGVGFNPYDHGTVRSSRTRPFE